MLSEKQINIIIDVLKPYNPTKIGIFGSVARGENTSGSDIDILYSLENEISLFKHIRLMESLKKSLNVDVDLVSETALHPRLKDSILNDLQIIYEN